MYVTRDVNDYMSDFIYTAYDVPFIASKVKSISSGCGQPLSAAGPSELEKAPKGAPALSTCTSIAFKGPCGAVSWFSLDDAPRWKRRGGGASWAGT